MATLRESAQEVFVVDKTNNRSTVVNADNGLEVHVNGTVATGGLTDAQLRATAVPVSGGIFVSTANSTTTPLIGAATYTGTGEDISQFAGTTINLAGSAAAACPGTLFFEYSPNGTNWDVSVPIAITDINTGMVPMPLRTVLPFFRVRYVNGALNQTTMRLTTVHHRVAPEELTRFVTQTIGAGEPVKITRSVIMGSEPDGSYENARLSGSDPGNSSTANLTAGAIFTGAWFDTTGFVGGMVMVKASHISAANGFQIQFSNDQTNITRTLTTSYIETTDGHPVFFPVMQGEYYRVKYTNGATGTTSLDIRAELFVVAAQNPMNALTSPINGNMLSQLSRGAIMAPNAAASWANVERGTSGGLDVGIVQHEVDTPIKSLPSFKCTRTTVTGTIGLIVTAPQTGRKSVSIKAACAASKTVYISHSNTATVGGATTYHLTNGDAIDIELDATSNIYAISDDASAAVSVMEVYE